jgi:hypothetical protein
MCQCISSLSRQVIFPLTNVEEVYTDNTYFITILFMQPQLVIQVDRSAEHDREVIEREVAKAMGMVDAYLRKYDDKPDAVVRIEVTVKKNSDGSFHGKLHANVDGQIILFEREEFWELKDLIHHAFQHMKEQLAAK